MFLHIGGNQVILLESLIGVFHTDLRKNQTNKEFLEAAIAAEDFPYFKKSNSFIVTEDQVFLSPISPTTLNNRIKKNKKIIVEG